LPFFALERGIFWCNAALTLFGAAISNAAGTVPGGNVFSA
jgi:hypothetical protein